MIIGGEKSVKDKKKTFKNIHLKKHEKQVKQYYHEDSNKNYI